MASQAGGPAANAQKALAKATAEETATRSKLAAQQDEARGQQALREGGGMEWGYGGWQCDPLRLLPAPQGKLASRMVSNLAVHGVRSPPAYHLGQS